MRWVVAFVVAVIYFISPIDLIPDLIPILGWTDDVGVCMALLAYASSGGKKS